MGAIPQFNSYKEMTEWYRVDARLVDICAEAYVVWPYPVFRITCIARTESEDHALGGSRVHSAGPPWRAVDIAGERGKTTWEDLQRVARAINEAWAYDPARPNLNVAVAKPHGTGPHLHVQVCRDTERRVK